MMSKFKICIPVLFLACICSFNSIQCNSTPVVLWHGMGDSCCFSFSLGAIKKLIEKTVPGIYVYSIRLGNNEIEDVEHSYFGNVNEQIREVCHQLSNNVQLKDGYNAIGFSQGAQFMRAIIQRCPSPSIKNFISIGGQHQGVFGLPNCGSLNHGICSYITRVLKYGAYLDYAQESLIQATYWHDPFQEDEYKKKSIFMADINNERYINMTYKENLQKLNTMVLVKFSDDTIVWPRESEWFGFYKPGQGVEVQTFQETDLYRQDRVGLKSMHEAGKVHLLQVPGNHLQFSKTWFVDNIIKKYLV